MIGITGATGRVGNRTARYVADRQTPVPLIVRDPTRAPDLKADVRAPSSYGTGDEMRAAREASTPCSSCRPWSRRTASTSTAPRCRVPVCHESRG
jgi:nucleoside-diphosphate-sugar epimerase